MQIASESAKYSLKGLNRYRGRCGHLCCFKGEINFMASSLDWGMKENGIWR